MNNKKCVICGKEFAPKSTRHCTCSAECSKKNGRAWKKRPEVIKARQERMIAAHKLNNTACRICGEKVEHTLGKHEKSYKRMHEECIIEDSIRTLMSGKRMTSCQYSRLQSVGYGVKELWMLIGERGIAGGGVDA